MYNPFIKLPHEYQRDINIIPGYIEQQAFYLSKMTGKELPICKAWVIDKLKNDENFKLHDPTVYYLSREKQQDRVKATMSLSQYITSVANADYVMVPTFTVYTPEEVTPSLYTSYIQRKKKERKYHKKLMFKATMEGNKDVEQAENNNQQAKKIRINSLSGAALQAYTVSYTASLHPTLTSVCRISTSYANANNEKFMGGNRAYYTEQVTLDNINFLALNADKQRIEDTIVKYDLVYPSLEQAIQTIRRSSDVYWSMSMPLNTVQDYLAKCEPHELANIVYNGDFYHLGEFNRQAVTRFIEAFVDYVPKPIDNAVEWLENIADEHTMAYVSLICSELLIGKQLADVKVKEPQTYALIGDVCRHTFETMGTYGDFIETFIRPDHLNPEVYDIDDMVRQVVITSDTDSTIFTTQHWTKFITGSYNFEPKSYKVGYFMTLMSSQMTRHLLATMCRNIGIKESNLTGISMKSEYMFSTYVITPSAKHYYATIAAREGNVFAQRKLEVKGVGLRTSKLPDVVMGPFKDHLVNTLEGIIANNGLTLAQILKEPIRVETMVRESLESGSTQFLSTQQLKDSNSFTRGVDAPNYKYHVTYNELFGEKYGMAPPLPYMAVKISTKLNNKTELAKWVARIEDKQIAAKVAEYIRREGKSAMGTMYIPLQLFNNRPIPVELIQIMDVGSLLSAITAPWYIYLESMGFYFKNKHNTRLISDEFKALLPYINKTQGEEHAV